MLAGYDEWLNRNNPYERDDFCVIHGIEFCEQCGPYCPDCEEPRSECECGDYNQKKQPTRGTDGNDEA